MDLSSEKIFEWLEAQKNAKEELWAVIIAVCPGKWLQGLVSHMAANQHIPSLLNSPALAQDANQSPRDLSTVWLVQIYSISQPSTFIKDDISHRRKGGSPDNC